jgi:hypothetical protein
VSDPIDRFTMACPAEFFRRLMEYFDAAFGEAHAYVNRRIEEPERANMLGQERHAGCEAAFRAAAKDSGLAFHASHTRPAGGRYSIVMADGAYLIRSNIQTHIGTPRPTSFRKEWAALNAWLYPIQLDLLQEVPDPPSDRVCGIIVATAHPRRGDPTVPAFVGLGIPRHDLSAWVSLTPLPLLLARYHDLDAAARQPKEAVAQVKDQAKPTLKKRLEGGGKE